MIIELTTERYLAFNRRERNERGIKLLVLTVEYNSQQENKRSPHFRNFGGLKNNSGNIGQAINKNPATTLPYHSAQYKVPRKTPRIANSVSDI